MGSKRTGKLIVWLQIAGIIKEHNYPRQITVLITHLPGWLRRLNDPELCTARDGGHIHSGKQ